MARKKYIGVFCGSSAEGAASYAGAARELARVMVQNGFGLVFGGANSGLMQIMADEVLKQGGDVIGITTPNDKQSSDTYTHKNPVYKNRIKILKAADLSERKKQMIELSDGFITLPGGLGTYDELGEVTTYNKSASYMKKSVKPCGVLNTDGFYDHTMQQLNRAVQEKFVHEDHFNMIQFASEPNKLVEYIANFYAQKTENMRWWEEEDLPSVVSLSVFKKPAALEKDQSLNNMNLYKSSIRRPT